MNTITSRDGTTIAYDQSGTGPALVLVGGAFEQRAMESDTAKLAVFPLMSEHFTVYHYDRRGRGDSTDNTGTPSASLQREIDDIEALINEAGGSAFLLGISSGAALAFEASLALGSKVKKLAMYEAPYNDDDDARQAWRKFRQELDQAVAEDRRGDAVSLFMMLMGMPPEQLDEMRQYPMWPMFEAIAPTIAYDGAAIGEDGAVPAERAARLTIPALIMDGSESFPFMHVSAAALAEAIPNAQHRTLEGQVHEVEPEAIGPVLVEFFTA